MPIPDEILNRIKATAREIQQACERANMSFVVVMEPRDARTGVFIVSDENDDGDPVVRSTRDLLDRAVERLRHTRYSVVTVDPDKEPEPPIDWREVRPGTLVQRSPHWVREHHGRGEGQLGMVVDLDFVANKEGDGDSDNGVHCWPVVLWEGTMVGSMTHPANAVVHREWKP